MLLKLPYCNKNPCSQARVSAQGFRAPSKPAWAEHFSRGGGMPLSANHSSCLLFTNAFDTVLIFRRFWKADPRSWNRKGCCEAVSESCCLFCEQWIGGNYFYPNKGTSVTISDASSKEYSAQADLLVSLKQCAETLACEDMKTYLSDSEVMRFRYTLWQLPL